MPKKSATKKKRTPTKVPKKATKKPETDYKTMYQRYLKMFNEVNIGVALFRVKGNKFYFEDYNKTAEKIDGVKKKDLLGKEIREVFPGSADKDFGLLKVFARVLKTGKSELIGPSKYEDDNGIRWMENYVYKISDEEIVAVYTNVSRWVEMKNRLAKTQRLAALGGWEYDTKTQKFSWSDEIFHICECDPQEFKVTKAKHFSFIHPEDRAKVEKVFEQALNSKTGYVVEERIVTKTGSTKYIRSIGEVEVDKKGSVTKIIGTFHDITRQKEIEMTLEERIEDLQKLNKLMIERELKMIELKKENAELKLKIHKMRA